MLYRRIVELELANNEEVLVTRSRAISDLVVLLLIAPRLVPYYIVVYNDSLSQVITNALPAPRAQVKASPLRYLNLEDRNYGG